MGSDGASVAWAPSSRALLQLAAERHAAAAMAAAPAVRTEWAWDRRNAAGLVLSALIGFFTGPGGGGGAQLYYPLFQLVLGFDVRTTASLVSCVMMLGALSSVGCALVEPHPNRALRATRPLIDYAALLAVCPPLLLGVSVGVIFNSILPEWLLFAATIGIFVYSLKSTVHSCVRLTRRDAADIKKAKETAAAPAAKAANSAPEVKAGGGGGGAPVVIIVAVPEMCSSDDDSDAGGIERSAISNSSSSSSNSNDAGAVARDTAPVVGVTAAAVSHISSSSSSSSAPHAQTCLQRVGERLRQWRAVQPVKLQLLVLGVLAVHIGGTMLTDAAAKPCSPEMWGFKSLQAGAMVILTIVAGALVLRWTRAAAAAADAAIADAAPVAAEMGAAASATPVAATAAAASWRDGNYDFIRWRARDLLVMPLPMVLIGVIAGCLGLGGGFLMVPLLLAMGLHPQVQAGTCKVVLLISTAASTLSLLVAGRLPIAYGIAYGVTNLLAAPLGIVAFNWVIRRTGRPSLLVALNVARFTLGTSLLFALAGVPSWRRAALGLDPIGLQLQNLCHSAAAA